MKAVQQPVLLPPRQGPQVLEQPLRPADRPGVRSDGHRRPDDVATEQLLDGDVEDASEPRQQFGPRRRGAPFPKRDVGVGHAERPSELDLSEACARAKGKEVLSLGRTRTTVFGRFSRHGGMVRDEFGRSPGAARWGGHIPS